MRRLFPIILTITILLGTAHTCLADGRTFAVGVRGSLMQFTGGNNWSLDDMELEMNNTLAYGISASYFFNDHFSIEATLEQYRDADGDVKPLPTLTDNVSNIAQTFITLSPTLHWPVGKRVTPYIGAGISYFYNDFDKESYFNEIFSRAELDDSWGFQASVGADIMLTPSWAFNIDIRYQWTEPTFNWTLNTDGRSGDDKFTLAGVMTAVGIKYQF